MPDMQTIMKLVGERKEKLTHHPFFNWVKVSGVPLEERLNFAPIMANFVMNFRDMNKWFIRFDEAENRFKAIINGNTEEDETHSRLFLEDWRKLKLDEKLGWQASDTLWWLFLADDTEPFRAYAMDFAKLTVADGGDPLLRFTHSEAGEACGNAFFEVVSRVAREAGKMSGNDYRYFGDYHLNRERGHVIASEGVFETQPLDPPRENIGLNLANTMFDIFFGMHDRFFQYAVQYVGSGHMPRRVRTAPPPLRPAPSLEDPALEQATAEHAPVERRLAERKKRTADHPFYKWLQSNAELTPLNKLQRFIPMWIMDIMGYRDLNRYALRFGHPKGSEELAFNRWVDALESHSWLFMNDWDALALDNILGWNASDTLEFLFLDPNTDVHRRNIASFIKLALRHPEPTLRFWLLEALEASGEAFFANTRRLATAVEHLTDVRLDYLGDRHYLAHPRGAHARAYPFKTLPMSPLDRDIAIAMVDRVFDSVDEQLHLSLEAARTNKFRIPASGALVQ